MKPGRSEGGMEGDRACFSVLGLAVFVAVTCALPTKLTANSECEARAADAMIRLPVVVQSLTMAHKVGNSTASLIPSIGVGCW